MILVPVQAVVGREEICAPLAVVVSVCCQALGYPDLSMEWWRSRFTGSSEVEAGVMRMLKRKDQVRERSRPQVREGSR